MRVLHVLDISIPVLAGYTSRSKYIVNNQKALGIEPVVLTSVRQKNESGCSMEELEGINYHRTPEPRAGILERQIGDRPVLREGFEIQHLRKRIIQVAKRERPDIIHAHSSILCGIPGYLAARQLGLPFVYEIRSFWEDAAVDSGKARIGDPRYVATKQAETTLSRGADAVIGICQGIKEELLQRGIDERDVHVIKNGVEADRFVPMAKDEEMLDRYNLRGKTVVAYIGTFADFEGVEYLVKALIQLIQSGRDDLRGLIVGKGPRYKHCRQLAQDAGLLDKIVHPGRVDHSVVKQVYSVVDILAYPRDRQRITELVTPLKPLEAMAMEKAVIGSDVGGLIELIEKGHTGLIHKAEDVGSLAEKILAFADNPDLRARCGKSGREYVLRTRQWRKIIEGHFEVYDRARENWRKNRLIWRGIASTLGRF